jgi:hypothetical protein
LEGIDPALFCVASVAPLAKEPAKSISAVGSLVSTPLVSGVQAGGRDPENHRHQRPFMALLDTVQARGLTPGHPADPGPDPHHPDTPTAPVGRSRHPPTLSGEIKIEYMIPRSTHGYAVDPG